MEKQTNILLEKHEKENNAKQVFKCTSCSFETNSKSGLKFQMRKKHTKVENDIFPRNCHLCEEIFQNKKN